MGTVGHVATYFGGVAADEPHAAVVGRDVLSAGGTAMDAAVAMYFAMSVTLPSAAGLGGGGVCVTYSAHDNKAQTLDFRGAPPQEPVPAGRWAAAAPGNVRGMFALQSRYGRLHWEELVQPAERMARFGTPVSRALALALQHSADRIEAEPDARRIFAGAKGGSLLAEGDMLRRVGLGATLGRIRSVGPGDFYTGALAQQYVDGVRDAGGWLTKKDMRDMHPVWRDTIDEVFGNHLLHFASGVAGGRIAATVWQAIRAGDNSDQTEADRLYRLSEAARTAYREAGARPDVDYGTAGLIVMDPEGNAVSCDFGMNEAFGSGRTAGQTGVLIARPAKDPVSAAAALAPVLMANHNDPQAFLAASAGGDSSAPVALVSTLMRALEQNKPVPDALAAFRVTPGAKPRSVLLERNAGQTLAGEIAAKGANVYPVDSLGRVNLMYCLKGVHRVPESCDVRADPRGAGYAINAEF